MLVDQGRAVGAIALLHEALAIDPGFRLARNNLGIAYAVSGERAFRRQIAADPGFATGHENLARVLADTGRPAEAAEMRRALQRQRR